MNILGWQLSFRKSGRERTSPFTAVLPRVRTMRENCDWPAATTPATVEQRRSRILTARRGITYRPAAHEGVDDSQAKLPRSRWLWVGGILMLLASAVVSGILLSSGAQDSSGVYQCQYQFAYPPPFLSDGTAISAALDTMTRMGIDQAWLSPLQVTNRTSNLAPDGSRDTYLMRTPTGNPNSGIVIFESERAGVPGRIVHLQLQSNRMSVTISPVK